jgi:diacylglycerol kinase (ATP)
MRPLLIVNPHAGGGKTGRLFDEMLTPIRSAIGEFDVERTELPRHAVAIARDAALAGRETVVAVGGDGSIHEVVSGLMEARDKGAAGTRLGIIGQGTGGDFRKTLGIEHRLDRYCAAIAGGTTRRLDVGRFTYTAHDGGTATAFFANILSVGIGGTIDRLVAEGSRALGGTVAYMLASLRALSESRVGRVRCTTTLRGEKRETVIATRTLAICNGRFFGSGMKVAPMAEPDDGLFEVIDLGSAPLLRFATVSTRMYNGSHLRQPDVRHFQCDRIELELLNQDVEPCFRLDVDGEPLGRLPITVTLDPGAIEVLAPPAPPR